VQAQAALLKAVMSGGRPTKIIAVGIGDNVDESEMNEIASEPTSENVILVDDFDNLHTVEEQLRVASCFSQYDHAYIAVPQSSPPVSVFAALYKILLNKQNRSITNCKLNYRNVNGAENRKYEILLLTKLKTGCAGSRHNMPRPLPVDL